MDTREIEKNLKELKDEYLQKVRTLFFKEVQEKVFDVHPEIVSFGFRAYQQYFNDGEETEYQVYDDLDGYGLFINGYAMGYGYEDDDEDDDDENCFEYFAKLPGEYNFWRKHGIAWNSKGTSKALDTAKSVQSFVRAFDADTWKTIVGDHVIVRFTRDSIEIKSYDHD